MRFCPEIIVNEFIKSYKRQRIFHKSVNYLNLNQNFSKKTRKSLRFLLRKLGTFGIKKQFAQKLKIRWVSYLDLQLYIDIILRNFGLKVEN